MNIDTLLKKIKKLNKKQRTVGLVIIAAVVVLASGLGFALHNRGTNITASNATNLPDIPPHTLSGKITSIFHSCGIQTLDSSGNVVNQPGLCDGGNGIVVNSVRIMTGGGSMPTSSSNGYEPVYDISGLKPGDHVTVKYVFITKGVGNLDCKHCSIKKQ